ncbi:MAG: heparan-alpha-glucosaminide N-acetyltransferase domain-containing protein [bacterium]|nr:heparan-alpha-glucosaminide N-acetyltransferase domain-containing protein [bacterium]
MSSQQTPVSNDKQITGRITSIDLVRGLVIVIMALDHTRDLIHANALGVDPLDLKVTTPALYLTRWITHLCAPVFVFLAGTSVYLNLLQQGDIAKTIRFVRIRGVLLILMELTIINFGFWSDLYFRTFLVQVIFAIGAGFFILSFLLRLKARTLGIIGLLIIFLHDLVTGLPIEGNTFLKFIYSIFLDSGFFKLAEDRAFIVGYSIIPWLGIMLFGFSFGKSFLLEDKQRKKTFLYYGFGALFLFVALRFLNGYGDISPWSMQSSRLYTFLSFMDVSKYPPSLMYTAITLAIMFFVLRLADQRGGALVKFFLTYGKVPMFFYILHWYVIHIGMYVMLWLQGFTWNDLNFGIMGCGRPETGGGLDLPFVYVYWISVILVMFPLCRWYGKYKSAHKDVLWLKYI